MHPLKISWFFSLCYSQTYSSTDNFESPIQVSGLYSVAEIWLKKIENGKNNFLDEEQNNSKKVYVNIK